MMEKIMYGFVRLPCSHSEHLKHCEVTVKATTHAAATDAFSHTSVDSRENSGGILLKALFLEHDPISSIQILHQKVRGLEQKILLPQ